MFLQLLNCDIPPVIVTKELLCANFKNNCLPVHISVRIMLLESITVSDSFNKIFCTCD
jgi:hypothetical protein